MASLPAFEPMPLAVIRRPFDLPDWLYELKLDGLRALAVVAAGECRLVSRKGVPYKRFPQLAAAIARAVPGRAVLDGEIVHLDATGKPQFYDLMRLRTPQHFYAFDLLWQGGTDQRHRPLIERKRRLREMIPKERASQLRYVEHVHRAGTLLYNAVCARDLEGIVAKQASGLYTPAETSWVKVKNPGYSQNEGRRELFQKAR